MAERKAFKRLMALSIMAAGGYLLGKRQPSKLNHTKPEQDPNLDSAERELEQLHSELETLMQTAKNAAKPLKGYSLKQLNNALKTVKLAKQRLAEVIEAVKSGEANDRDLAFAIKEAEQAFKHAKKFLLKN